MTHQDSTPRRPAPPAPSEFDDKLGPTVPVVEASASGPRRTREKARRANKKGRVAQERLRDEPAAVAAPAAVTQATARGSAKDRARPAASGRSGEVSQAAEVEGLTRGAARAGGLEEFPPDAASVPSRREQLQSIVFRHRTLLAASAADFSIARLFPEPECAPGGDADAAEDRIAELLDRNGLMNWLARRVTVESERPRCALSHCGLPAAPTQGAAGSPGVPHAHLGWTSPSSRRATSGPTRRADYENPEELQGSGCGREVLARALALGSLLGESVLDTLRRIAQDARDELVARHAHTRADALRRELERMGFGRDDLEAMAAEVGPNDSVRTALLRTALHAQRAAAWAPTPPSNPVVPGTDLTERQVAILDSLLDEGATESASRITTARLTSLVDGPRGVAKSFKRPVAALVRMGLLASRACRDGGVWLTAEGAESARSLRATG